MLQSSVQKKGKPRTLSIGYSLCFSCPLKFTLKVDYTGRYLQPFNFQVQAQEQLVFYLVPNSDLWIYLIAPGDEFYLHYESWSDPFPFTFRHMGHIITQDVVMKKHLSFDDSQNCETKVDEQPYIGR